MTYDLRTRFAVDDDVLTALHARAFGGDDGGDDDSGQDGTTPWAERLARHSVAWVGAFDGDRLVGFVHACWDGGAHAFVLDTCVDPDHRRRGVGRALLAALVPEVAAAGCRWLHVDHEPHLEGFYRDACGVRPTTAGVLALGPGPRG